MLFLYALRYLRYLGSDATTRQSSVTDLVPSLPVITLQWAQAPEYSENAVD